MPGQPLHPLAPACPCELLAGRPADEQHQRPTRRATEHGAEWLRLIARQLPDVPGQPDAWSCEPQPRELHASGWPG
eukprot:11175179-Lingulodinium_polyedra.AAC.1